MLPLAAVRRRNVDCACARKIGPTMTKKLIIAEKPSVANNIARDRAHERAPGL